MKIMCAFARLFAKDASDSHPDLTGDFTTKVWALSNVGNTAVINVKKADRAMDHPPIHLCKSLSHVALLCDVLEDLRFQSKGPTPGC
jgi:hypothetical protein